VQKLSESVTLLHQENESAMGELEETMQPRLKSVNRHIDLLLNQLRQLRGRQLRRSSDSGARRRGAEAITRKLDREVNKKRTRVEVAEQRPSEEVKELDREFA
jgi:hypothetical protein